MQPVVVLKEILFYMDIMRYCYDTKIWNFSDPYSIYKIQQL